MTHPVNEQGFGKDRVNGKGLNIDHQFFSIHISNQSSLHLRIDIFLQPTGNLFDGYMIQVFENDLGIAIELAHDKHRQLRHGHQFFKVNLHNLPDLFL